MCHFLCYKFEKEEEAIINSGHKNENNKRYNKPSTTGGVG